MKATCIISNCHPLKLAHIFRKVKVLWSIFSTSSRNQWARSSTRYKWTNIYNRNIPSGETSHPVTEHSSLAHRLANPKNGLHCPVSYAGGKFQGKNSLKVLQKIHQAIFSTLYGEFGLLTPI